MAEEVMNFDESEGAHHSSDLSSSGELSDDSTITQKRPQRAQAGNSQMPTLAKPSLSELLIDPRLEAAALEDDQQQTESEKAWMNEMEKAFKKKLAALTQADRDAGDDEFTNAMEFLEVALLDVHFAVHDVLDLAEHTKDHSSEKDWSPSQKETLTAVCNTAEKAFKAIGVDSPWEDVDSDTS